MKKLFCFGLFIFSSGIVFGQGSLRIIADEWCPYSCDPHQAQEGYAVDLFRAIFEPAGYVITYELLPWSRAIDEFNTGQADAIIGTSPHEVPQAIFPEESIAVYYNYFFVRSDMKWEYESVDSLNEYRIGGVKDYNYLGLMNYILENEGYGQVELLTGAKTTLRNFQKLLNHRIDILIEDINVGLYLIHQLGFSDKVKVAGREGEGVPLFIAFSPENEESQNHANRFSTGIQQLRANRLLDQILSAYGLTDWKESVKSGSGG